MKLGLRRLFSFSLSESRLLLFLCCCRPRLFFLAPAECSALRALISGQTGLRLFLAQFLAMGSLTGSAIITRKHWPRFGRFHGTPNCCREAMRFSKNGVLWVSFSAGFSAHYVPLCRWLPASAACRNFPFKSPISPRRSFGQRACSPQARLPSNGCCNAERGRADYCVVSIYARFVALLYAWRGQARRNAAKQRVRHIPAHGPRLAASRARPSA